MELKLYSFDEALKKLKNNEMPMLIRAKYLEADFINKCILLYSTKRYVSLGSSCVSGVPNTLRQTVLNEDLSRTTQYAKIESDDILAEDYIDTSEWKLFEYKDEYDKEIRHQ